MPNTPPTVAGDNARLILTHEGSKVAVMNVLTGRAAALEPSGFPSTSAGAIRFLPRKVTLPGVPEASQVPESVHAAALTEVITRLRVATGVTSTDEAAYWLVANHSDCGAAFMVDALLLYAKDRGDTVDGRIIVRTKGLLILLDPATGEAIELKEEHR